MDNSITNSLQYLIPFAFNHIDLNGTTRFYRYYKIPTEKTISQLDDGGLFYSPSSERNSVAVLMKHISGNMISRWTNFRRGDGEKLCRKRDSEFRADFSPRSELKAYWRKGWFVLYDAL